jgi:polysaccharide biosynthesis protein PslA
VVEDNLELGRPLAARWPTIGRQGLGWSVAALDGAVASVAMFVPAVIYHVAIQHVTFAQVPFGLYTSFALVAGLIYGGFSVLSVSRLLQRTREPQAMVADGALAWTVAFAVTLFLAFAAGVAGDLSRVSLISTYVLGLPILAGVRSITVGQLMGRIRAGRLRYQRIAIVGARQDVDRFVANGNLGGAGYEVAGTLYFEDIQTAGNQVEPRAVVSFAHRWVARGIEDIVFVGELGDVTGLELIVGELKRFSVNLVCAPATGNTTFKYLDVVRMGPNNALRFLKKPMGDGAVLMKRLFDICGAGLGLLLLSPLFIAVAILIKLDSPGPVFYRQERRGFNGESFHIWKFRSMRVTESGRAMVQAQKDDPRITGIGRFIRANSIDELPQLINVLLGNMSLVGPRPHAIMHDDELGHQVARYVHRQRIKPGITGWAQVNGYRGETRTMAQIEGRTAHDLFYADNWSLLFDVRIIWLTLFSPRARQNAG